MRLHDLIALAGLVGLVAGIALGLVRRRLWPVALVVAAASLGAMAWGASFL